MKLKKILTGVLAAGLCAANLASIPASAYSGMSATVYAARYWSTPNSYWYLTLNADCTNFVSQCVKAGGVNMYGTAIAGVAGGNALVDSNSGKWYHYGPYTKPNSTQKYWKYTRTWSMVSDFRSCFQWNGHGNVYTYSVNNTSWYSTVQPGDVVQHGYTGHGHSVLCVAPKSGNSNPTFAAHSNNYYGRNMMYMVQDAKNNNNQYIYVIKPR